MERCFSSARIASLGLRSYLARSSAFPCAWMSVRVLVSDIDDQLMILRALTPHFTARACKKIVNRRFEISTYQAMGSPSRGAHTLCLVPS